MVIYKTMNDIYIPKAEIFCRNSETILSAELQAIEDPIYNETEIRDLKNKGISYWEYIKIGDRYD